MTTQLEHANALNNLHIKGDPLILFNVWDAGTALAMAEIGSKAIATGSWSVAASHGYEDGEKLPFQFALENLERIIASVDLPVTIDLESGYGRSSHTVEEVATKVILAGAVGINFEDQMIGGDGLYTTEEQCTRIQAICKATKQTGIPVFINARTDIFLKKCHGLINDGDYLEEAIYRVSKYAEAGANGFFVPGLNDIKLIEKLCALSPIPINIMMQQETPSLNRLAEVGVARISYGPNPYCLAINTLKEAGRRVLSLR